MKTSIVCYIPKPLLLVILGLSISFGVAGCGTTAGQNIAAAGEALGSYMLKKHIVNGVVDPVYLASYESEIPNISGLMAGKITPADLHTLLANSSAVALDSNQTQLVGFLDGVSQEFIQTNGNPITPQGAEVQAAAQQLAIGLGRAVGLVTGTNYVPATP
jgi:hypothetical protein